MINLHEVGAFVSTPTQTGIPVRFGLYLPGITPQAGYEVLVRVIHAGDHLTEGISFLDFPLTLVPDSPNNLWQKDVIIQSIPRTNFGQRGTYLYSYQLWQTVGGNRNLVTRWFTDPFARSTDEVGATFTTPAVPPFPWTDQGWKVPDLEDLVVYKLHVGEFNNYSFDGVISRLPYLKSLGVTCLKLMPVMSLKRDFDWGYRPLHYFAPNVRWGGVQGLKSLVNACHANGIAVILDVVYQHVDFTFPYNLIYLNAGITSPMIGEIGQLGPEIDFSKEFAYEYIKTANFHWLHEYHVDGFCYDEITDLYSSPTDSKYAKIAFDTYNESLKLPRFTPSGRATSGEYSRLFQDMEKYFKEKPVATSGHYRYDVALSFAGEDRVCAATLADILKRRGVKVFYDQYEEAFLLGKDLYAHLSELYQNKAHYCVIFISQHYARKVWPKHELQAAQARALKEKGEYILPIRLDDTEVTGLLPTIGYLDWTPGAAEKIAATIIAKLTMS